MFPIVSVRQSVILSIGGAGPCTSHTPPQPPPTPIRCTGPATLDMFKLC